PQSFLPPPRSVIAWRQRLSIAADGKIAYAVPPKGESGKRLKGAFRSGEGFSGRPASQKQPAADPKPPKLRYFLTVCRGGSARPSYPLAASAGTAGPPRVRCIARITWM